MDSYSILTGVGLIYIAPVGSTFPELSDAPDTPWRSLGETQDGVEVEHDEKIERIRTDQRTGVVKATRTEESLVVKTKLVEATLENLADALGVSVTDTPADVGTIGTREIPLYRGATVSEYAVLIRGYSPYLDGAAQYEIPRGFFGKVETIKYEKGKNASIPFSFESLEDLAAVSPQDRFGRLIAKDAEEL